MTETNGAEVMKVRNIKVIITEYEVVPVLFEMQTTDLSFQGSMLEAFLLKHLGHMPNGAAAVAKIERHQEEQRKMLEHCQMLEARVAELTETQKDKTKKPSLIAQGKVKDAAVAE